LPNEEFQSLKHLRLTVPVRGHCGRWQRPSPSGWAPLPGDGLPAGSPLPLRPEFRRLLLMRGKGLAMATADRCACVGVRVVATCQRDIPRSCVLAWAPPPLPLAVSTRWPWDLPVEALAKCALVSVCVFTRFRDRSCVFLVLPLLVENSWLVRHLPADGVQG